MTTSAETLDAIADLAHWFGQLVEARTRAEGLTPVRARLVHEIHVGGPVRQRDLAASAHLSPQQTAVTLDALVAAGLAQRAPDPTDRRAVRVDLTTQGRRVAATLEASRRRMAQALLGDLPTAEITRLATDLSRLSDRVRAQLAPAATGTASRGSSSRTTHLPPTGP